MHTLRFHMLGMTWEIIKPKEFHETYRRNIRICGRQWHLEWRANCLSLSRVFILKARGCPNTDLNGRRTMRGSVLSVGMSIFCRPWWTVWPEAILSRGLPCPSSARAEDAEWKHSIHDAPDFPRAFGRLISTKLVIGYISLSLTPTHTHTCLCLQTRQVYCSHPQRTVNLCIWENGPL